MRNFDYDMKFLNTALLRLVSSTFFAFAQNKKAKRISPMTPIEEVKGLPHVLIIGDSISIGTLPTRKGR